MKNIQLIGLLTLMLLSCNVPDKQKPKSANYDLKGNVKFLSEKKIVFLYDETSDTTKSYVQIINRYFDKNACINITEFFFNEDSTFLSSLKYYSDGTSILFDKEGNERNVSKIILVKDDIFYVEVYDHSTKKIIEKAWTKYDNEHIVWEKSIAIRDNFYMEDVYCRNHDGLDTIIKRKYGNENSEYSLINIKYLSFDKKGNWIERLEYSLIDTNNYILKQRRIEYYE